MVMDGDVDNEVSAARSEGTERVFQRISVDPD